MPSSTSLASVFSAAPAGNGLHSYRLAESIFLGAIPVIVDEKLVLPYCSVLDWSRFSVRVKRAQVPELPAILRAIPPDLVADYARAHDDGIWSTFLDIIGYERPRATHDQLPIDRENAEHEESSCSGSCERLMTETA